MEHGDALALGQEHQQAFLDNCVLRFDNNRRHIHQVDNELFHFVLQAVVDRLHVNPKNVTRDRGQSHAV